MKNLKIEIAREFETINGFTVKEGYVIFRDSDDKTVGISSGWFDRDLIYIYTHQDGEWVGNWEDEFDFPIDEAMEMLQGWQREQEIQELKTEIDKLLRDGVPLYKSDEPIRFTDEVAGSKSSDGGEYGFYSTYYPTDVVGIYEYYTSTTCEFDACGTGYEGLSILTQGKYEYLVSEEDKILRSN